MKKKLSLNKITVSNLNNKDLSKAHGGGTIDTCTCETALTDCYTDTCIGPNCVTLGGPRSNVCH